MPSCFEEKSCLGYSFVWRLAAPGPGEVVSLWEVFDGSLPFAGLASETAFGMLGLFFLFLTELLFSPENVLEYLSKLCFVHRQFRCFARPCPVVSVPLCSLCPPV